jgi:cell wall-associated NlpC family hydrolase
MTPRNRRLLGVFVGFALLLPLVGQPLASAAPIDDKRAEASRLQDQLEAQGEQVSILAERYNRAQVKVAEVEAGISQTEAEVARSDDRLKTVKGRLADAAIAAYMHGGASSFIGNMARSDGDNMIVRQQYLRVTASNQREIIGELRLAKEDLSLKRTELDGERKAARAAADDAAAVSHQAQAAQADQQALLSSVQGDISGLVAEEAARREAAEADQRRLAAVVPPAAIRLAAEPVVAAATPAAADAELPATRILPSSGLGGVAVDWAMGQLGKPYEYGGAGPDSFDCSGLTMRAWEAAGVSLSHGADIQWYETTRVSMDEIIPGDLLFYGDSVEGIHHVAMYIGDGQMIEASTTGTPIRIRGWRSGDLVGAGRPG